MISQNIVAQSQAFNSFGFYDLNNITGEMQVMLGKGLRETMLIGEQPRNTRIMKNFQVTLQKRAPGHLDSLMKGNTLDLSQGGAFIKTEGWHLFKPNEVTELTFFFATGFSGKDAPIGLQGSAIVRRVDKLRKGSLQSLSMSSGISSKSHCVDDPANTCGPDVPHDENIPLVSLDRILKV